MSPSLSKKLQTSCVYYADDYLKYLANHHQLRQPPISANSHTLAEEFMPSGPEILFLSKEDIDALALPLQEIMDVIGLGLKAHSEKKVRDALQRSSVHRGAGATLQHPKGLCNAPIDAAGVKVISEPARAYYRRPHDM
jgi:hypothetical protein